MGSRVHARLLHIDEGDDPIGSLRDLPVQGAEEGEQRLLLVVAQAERVQFAIEKGILVAAAVVVVDDFLQRRECAVVHVRRGARDLAKRGRLERAMIFQFAGHDETAFVLKPTCPLFFQWRWGPTPSAF